MGCWGGERLLECGTFGHLEARALDRDEVQRPLTAVATAVLAVAVHVEAAKEAKRFRR